MTVVGAVVGAILGLIVAPMIALGVGHGWAFLPLPPIRVGFSLDAMTASVVYLLILVMLYMTAVLGTPLTSTSAGLITSSWLEKLSRGAMIGLNAIMNVFLLPTAVLIASLPWSPVSGAATVVLPFAAFVAPAVGMIGMLSAIPSLSNSPSYQFMLGWTGFAMPMAWPIHLLGAVVWVVNFLFSWASPTRGFSDFTSATWITHGGILYWPFPSPAAYNLGAFVQIPRFIPRTTPGQWFNSVSVQTANGLALHEGGHNLNVAALGWWFHIVGFLEEVLFFGPGLIWPAGRFAYSEMLAEGRLRSARSPWLAVWTPSLTPPAPGNIPPTLGTCDVIPTAAPAVGVRVDCVTITPPVDPDGYVQAIGFLWILATKPAGSTAVIAAPNSPNTSFVPDLPGEYSAVLFVSDGADGGRVPFATNGTVVVP